MPQILKDLVLFHLNYRDLPWYIGIFACIIEDQRELHSWKYLGLFSLISWYLETNILEFMDHSETSFGPQISQKWGPKKDTNPWKTLKSLGKTAFLLGKVYFWCIFDVSILEMNSLIFEEYFLEFHRLLGPFMGPKLELEETWNIINLLDETCFLKEFV